MRLGTPSRGSRVEVRRRRQCCRDVGNWSRVSGWDDGGGEIDSKDASVLLR